MKTTLLSCLTVSVVLSACAGVPPKPPQPQGEFRPVNYSLVKIDRHLFNFQYSGGLPDALKALNHSTSHKIVMLTPTGTPSKSVIKLNLSGITVEQALNAIAIESLGFAEVSWRQSDDEKGYFVSVNYRQLPSQTIIPPAAASKE